MASRCRFSVEAISARRSDSALGGGELVAQLTAFELALSEDLHLLGEPRFQLLHAAAENLGFGGLRDQCALQLRDPFAKLIDAATLVVEFLRGGARLLALLIEAVADVPRFLFVVVDAVLERLDLGAQRHHFDTLAVGVDRALVQIDADLGELGFLVGQRPLGFA